MNPSMPSITSAMANVSSTDIIVRLIGRSRAISSRCIANPTTKNSGTVITSDSSGSSPVSRLKYHAR